MHERYTFSSVILLHHCNLLHLCILRLRHVLSYFFFPLTGLSRFSCPALVRFVFGSLLYSLLFNKRHGGLAVQRAQFNHDVCPDE